MAEIKRVMGKKGRKTFIGWNGDEMDIRHGGRHLPELHQLVGLDDGPIAEKDIKKIDLNTIADKIATKVINSHITPHYNPIQSTYITSRDDITSQLQYNTHL